MLRSFLRYTIVLLTLWLVPVGASAQSDADAPVPSNAVDPAPVSIDDATGPVPGGEGEVRNDTELAADRELEAFVDGMVATWQTVHGAPGYTVAVVRPDRTVFTKGYGLADVEEALPVDPAASRFYVASISKTFIWTAVMMLVEQGVLDLDADVNRYLERYTVPEDIRPLTLRDLMAHRGGYEDTIEVFSTQVAAMDRAAAMLATEPDSVFPRGGRMAYSNWGSNLTALIVEDATGRDYAELLFEDILKPLGMTSTTLTDASPAARDPATPVSKNYRVSASGPEIQGQLDLGSFAPIGGMTTTAADMARWMRFHLNRGELDGVRLLSEDGYAALRTRDFDPIAGAAGRARGFADIPYRSIAYYGHTGSINAFYSQFSIAPALGLGVFIAQNTSDDFDPLASVPMRVFDRELALRGEEVSLVSRSDPSEEDIAAAEAVAGRYISSRRQFSGPMKLFDAMGRVLEIKAEDGRLIAWYDNAPFARIAPDLWENRLGDRLAFVRAADGTVDHVITPGGAVDGEPVDWRTDPMIVGVALGATVLFSLTTWLGFWRRVRQQPEQRTIGRVLSVIALLAVVPLVWLAMVVSNAPSAETIDFAAFFAQWPPPFAADLVRATSVTAGTGLLMALCTVPAWTRSGWNRIRKVHFTMYALSYTVLALLFVHWDLVLTSV